MKIQGEEDEEDRIDAESIITTTPIRKNMMKKKGDGKKRNNYTKTAQKKTKVKDEKKNKITITRPIRKIIEARQRRTRTNGKKK